MTFVVIAQYWVRAGEEDKVALALREMVTPTRAEPGNLDYQVFRDPQQPSLFVLFEKYTDEAAFDAHRATSHFGTWLAGQVLPALENRIRLDLVPFGAVSGPCDG
jgi:quinol monooxygenase YgiN